MGIFGKLVSATVRTALLPVAVVQDIATMGGAVNDKKEPYTATAAKKIGRNISEALEELED
jgi:hypothetical protein